MLRDESGQVGSFGAEDQCRVVFGSGSEGKIGRWSGSHLPALALQHQPRLLATKVLIRSSVAMLASLISAIASHWPSIFLILVVAYLLYNKYGRGLSKFPGPVSASYTNWWRFYDVWRGHAQHTQIELHRRHGDIVRLGPNVLSFSNPSVIKEIYGLNKGFTKTEFYPVQNNVAAGERIQSLFSTVDEAYHARLRRCVNSAFSMSTLVSYEPLVDSTTTVFLDKTRDLFCGNGAVCDFSRWLQYYAFDVIGQVSFSKRLGFIDRNEDVDGIIAAIADTLEYSGTMGQQPWLDRYLLRKNPIKMFLMRHGVIASSNPIAAFAATRSDERRDEIKQLKSQASEQDIEKLEDAERGVDFLTRFLMAQKAHPEFMTDRRVLTATVSLINAGSDTTAISLSSVFYHLLKNPPVYRKLMSELDEAVAKATITPHESGVISWPDAQKLPYLDAVIQEAFRIFPAAGLMLERHVPPEGAVICGESIPGNTIVGCNAWVLHRRPEVFGKDVDVFRPERWLEASPEQLKDMKATMFQFGAGARTCIGRNISVLEVYKLVPSFLRKFEIELVHPEREWSTLNCWFVRQEDFKVRFSLRKQQ